MLTGRAVPQEAAVEAWKEACAMRRSGREPSRVDLASYFSSALPQDAPAEAGLPEVAPQVRYPLLPNPIGALFIFYSHMSLPREAQAQRSPLRCATPCSPGPL